MAKKVKHFIVVAWVTEEVEFDGRPFAADLGARPGTNVVLKGNACTWLRRGSDEDFVRALAHVESLPEEGTAFAYPLSEQDPLGRARREVVELFRPRDEILTDGKGCPIDKPVPPGPDATGDERVAYLRARADWADKVADAANRGFARELR